MDPSLAPMNDPTTLGFSGLTSSLLESFKWERGWTSGLETAKGLNLGSKTTHFGSIWGHSGGQDSGRGEVRSGIALWKHVVSQVTGYYPAGPLLGLTAVVYNTVCCEVKPCEMVGREVSRTSTKRSKTSRFGVWISRSEVWISGSGSESGGSGS